jgi:hypothetical protein
MHKNAREGPTRTANRSRGIHFLDISGYATGDGQHIRFFSYALM